MRQPPDAGPRDLGPPPAAGSAPEGDAVATTRSVTRRYGDVVAVDGVTLDVGRGEVLGLLGPNGAGKSTIVQLLCGLRRPSSGTVAVLGADPRDPAARSRLGVTPQQTGLPETLRVSEVLSFVARHFPDPVPTGRLLERVGLCDQARRQTGGLSGGQRRRLAVALALVGRPELILLDEPTSGLDVEARRAMWATVEDLRREGRTVLLCSHDMAEVEALADRVVVLDRGRVLAEGTVAEIRSRVPMRRVRLTAASLPDLPDVQHAAREADRHELWTVDSDALVREIVAAGTPFRDLEVTAASLEDAFLAVTLGDDAPGRLGDAGTGTRLAADAPEVVA